jgi:rhomboid protease GluP
LLRARSGSPAYTSKPPPAPATSTRAAPSSRASSNGSPRDAIVLEYRTLAMSSPKRDDDRDREQREKREDPIPDWIETVTGIAGSLGFNKVRVRWKLQGWVNRRRAAARRGEQQSLHVKYQHRVCPHCGAVNDRAEKVCTRCTRPLGSRAGEILRRFGIHAPRVLSLGSLVGIIIVAAYVRILAEHGGGVRMPMDALIAHGAMLPLEYNGGETWRAATAVLLHANLMHLAFNLFALASVAPLAEDRFGRGVAVLMFLVTGVVGAFGSAMLGPMGVGVGASGAIMGLVGAVAVAGHRSGTYGGRAERDDMIKWILYTFILGWAIGADNYAHGAGLVAGGAFGFLPTKQLTRANARTLQIALGAVGLAGLLAATVAVMVPLQSANPFADGGAGAGDNADIGEWPTDDPGDPDDLGTMLWMCSDRASFGERLLYGGKAEIKRTLCANLDELRATCRERAARRPDAPPPSPTTDDWVDYQCADLRRLDGRWPPPRPR